MSKTKLPKRVAGIKIPKPLRRAVGAAIEQAATPAGRELIAGALVAAAAALRREPAASGAGEEPARPRPPVDMGALLGMAATGVLGSLRAAAERRGDASPTRPGEA